MYQWNCIRQQKPFVHCCKIYFKPNGYFITLWGILNRFWYQRKGISSFLLCSSLLFWFAQCQRGKWCTGWKRLRWVGWTFFMRAGLGKCLLLLLLWFLCEGPSSYRRSRTGWGSGWSRARFQRCYLSRKRRCLAPWGPLDYWKSTWEIIKKRGESEGPEGVCDLSLFDDAPPFNRSKYTPRKYISNANV